MANNQNANELNAAEQVEKSVAMARKALINGIDFCKEGDRNRLAIPLIDALRCLAEFDDDYLAGWKETDQRERRR